jgi:hypothetical protein
MPSIQQDILWDDNNGQVITHIWECHGDSNWYTLNLTNMSYARPLGPHVWQPSMKSLLSQNWVSAPWMKSRLLGIVWPGHHLGLPHSPSNKPPRSREGRFNKVVIGLLGLPSPINPTCGQYKSKLAIEAKMMRSLIDTGGGYHLEISE